MKKPHKLLWFLGVLVCLVVAAAIELYERPITVFNHWLYIQMDATGAHSRWITVNGIRIHYYEQGPKNAPPVVLVHGLGGHAEDWRNLRPWILGANHRIYMLDLPGHGRSEWPRDFSYSIPDQANVVVAFMDALGLKQVDLGGWSMGGWVVQVLAIQHPDRVKRLMLFDSAGLAYRPQWNTDLFMPTTTQQLDQLDALLMPHPPPVPGFIARGILRFSREHAWVLRRAVDSMVTGKDTTDDELSQLKMPVLIVWGTEDHITPIAQGEKMHQLIPQSEFDPIPGCGHLAPVQCAEQIGPAVTNFLK